VIAVVRSGADARGLRASAARDDRDRTGRGTCRDPETREQAPPASVTLTDRALDAVLELPACNAVHDPAEHCVSSCVDPHGGGLPGGVRSKPTAPPGGTTVLDWGW
jgi:hypothetical protein